MKIYTKKGDAGDTGLLFGGARVSKAGGRTEAAGCVDEAVAVLGVARATLPAGDALASMVIRLQRELFVVGAELSTHRIRRARLTPGVSMVTGEMVETLELEIDRLTKANPMPTEFIVPGESPQGAALDVARSVVRRAERRAVALAAAERLPDSLIVPYLNRLADLLFVMARVADGGFRPVRSRE